MKIKQTLLTLLAATVLMVAGGLINPSNAQAAISQKQFVNILCSSGSAVSECKKKGLKNGKLTVGQSTYKFSDWKGQKASDLREAASLGATTPKQLEKKRKENKKNKQEQQDGDSKSPITGNDCGGVQTAIIKCNENNQTNKIQDNGVWGLLLIAINILTAGVAIVAVGGIVYGSVLYASAANNASQVQKAREIITNVVIGIIAYVGMYSILQFIIPGGIFS